MILLLFMFPLIFGTCVPYTEYISSYPTTLGLTIKGENATLTLHAFIPEEKPVKNGIIIVKLFDESGKLKKICKAITDEDGTTTVKITDYSYLIASFCYYNPSLSCAFEPCLRVEGKTYSLDQIPFCEEEAPLTAATVDGIPVPLKPSSVSSDIISLTPELVGVNRVCLPALLILSALLAIVIASGQNPLIWFDFSLLGTAKSIRLPSVQYMSASRTKSPIDKIRKVAKALYVGAKIENVIKAKEIERSLEETEREQGRVRTIHTAVPQEEVMKSTMKPMPTKTFVTRKETTPRYVSRITKIATWPLRTIAKITTIKIGDKEINLTKPLENVFSSLLGIPIELDETSKELKDILENTNKVISELSLDKEFQEKVEAYLEGKTSKKELQKHLKEKFRLESLRYLNRFNQELADVLADSVITFLSQHRKELKEKLDSVRITISKLQNLHESLMKNKQLRQKINDYLSDKNDNVEELQKTILDTTMKKPEDFYLSREYTTYLKSAKEEGIKNVNKLKPPKEEYDPWFVVSNRITSVTISNLSAICVTALVKSRGGPQFLTSEDKEMIKSIESHLISIANKYKPTQSITTKQPEREGIQQQTQPKGKDVDATIYEIADQSLKIIEEVTEITAPSKPPKAKKKKEGKKDENLEALSTKLNQLIKAA